MLDKDVKKNQSYLFFNINKLLDETVQETENLEEWEIFLVKDLFKGYIWNRIAVYKDSNGRYYTVIGFDY